MGDTPRSIIPMNPTVVLVHGAMHTPWIVGPSRERARRRWISCR